MIDILRIAVCEDDPADTERLVAFIKQAGIASDMESFETAEALLSDFEPGKYDLIFLDIFFCGKSGMYAAQTIRGMDKIVALAFTTTSIDHALDSYRVGALKYLEKPMKAEGVKETLELALMKINNRPYITLSIAGGGKKDVPLDSILYFESQNRAVAVHVTSGVITTSRAEKLDGLEESLPSPPFLRCHRSFIVNLDYARAEDRDLMAFVMESGDMVFIRRGMFAKCKKARNERLIGELRKDMGGA